MDWQEILSQLTVTRLSKLAANAGMTGTSRLRKAQLVDVLHERLDDALRVEALALFTGSELRLLVDAQRLKVPGTRKPQLITALLQKHAEDSGKPLDATLELSDEDFMLPDRHRLDLPQGHNVEADVEVLPCRPGAAEATLFFEVQELLRRPTLSRAVIVTAQCDDALLSRLLGEGLDDLVESAVRWRSRGPSQRPLITIILDGTHHGLSDSEAGRALSSLARRLRGRLDIRLAPAAQQLEANVLVFEESRSHGAYLTGFVGAAHLPIAGVTRPGVEANLRVAGPLESQGNAASLLKEWITHLVRDARALRDADLEALPSSDEVLRKVDYKLHFDTAHELRLKHLAELACRRGFQAAPMYDPAAVEPLPTHQQAAVARAAEPGRQGVLLFDDNGLGKTVEAGMILSRELRRRRVFASNEAVERRRALVVAPTSMHSHWREELTGKFGLEAEVVSTLRRRSEEPSSWGGGDAQIVICGPEAAREHWEDIQGFEILCVDEAHLYDEEVYAALLGIRRAAELCIVASGTPAQHDVSDVLQLAALAMPDDAWDTFAALAGVDDVLSAELCASSTRARRKNLRSTGRLATRRMIDKFYDFEPVEADAYVELRRIRFDYLERGGHQKASAFLASEQTFLSSLQAFHATVCRLIGDGPRDHADLLPPVPTDRSFSFLTKSSYFRRRLRNVRDALDERCRPDAPVSPKEAALLEVLAECKGKPVVVFTRYRATQQRIGTVLERAKLTGLIEQIDGESSLRERLGVLSRFRARAHKARPAGGPSGILVCTDAAAEELALHHTATTLINYDLPWNPQHIERRIMRLQRWGQKEDVQVYNIAARNPKAEGWTMDNRVLYASRRLFDIGEERGRVSDALFEVEPDVLESELAGDESELSLIEEPDDAVVARIDELLRGAPDTELLARVEQAHIADRAYRDHLGAFWSHVVHGQAHLEGARGYLFSRLQLALLQGMVGVLCAPDRTVAECYTFSLAVGLRLLFESATHAAGDDPMDDQFLVDDEVVYLWAVAPDGQLVDWSQFLMGSGLAEVPHEDAAALVGKPVLDYLVETKRTLETRDLDAVPLAVWRRSAPEGVRDKLDVALHHAEALAQAREGDLERAWSAAKQAQLARLRARHAAATKSGAPPQVLASIDAAIRHGSARSAKLRHSILGTQLFLILH